ncbi:MAG: YbhB/YbcL family Raf kinase inhibitor-like protein [Bacteroidia bacterium]
MLYFLLLMACLSCNNNQQPGNSVQNNNSLNKPANTMEPNTQDTPENLKITSTPFESGQSIPAKYTCDGEDINPHLNIEGMPIPTQTLALIMEDPDAPSGMFIHWLCWDLPPVSNIDENSQMGTQGINSFGKKGYKGPCPPRNSKHHYNFKVYALDAKLDLQETATRAELEKAMESHIIAKGELQGLYTTD